MKLKMRLHFILLLVVIFSSAVFAQDFIFVDNTWTVYKTSNSGLPSNYVNAIAIDQSGNKWIGTTDFGGLAKFDGTNWTVYDNSNSGIPNNSVLAISIDQIGNKWIGTSGGGLSVFVKVELFLLPMVKPQHLFPKSINYSKTIIILSTPLLSSGMSYRMPDLFH